MAKTTSKEEHWIQSGFFQWAAIRSGIVPELDLLFAIPNAARRTARQGAWMKQEGMRAGVPDVCLPVSRGPYVGLWLEFKTGKGKLSEAQEEWHWKLRRQGHAVVVPRSLEEAMDAVERYLEGEAIDPEATPAFETTS